MAKPEWGRKITCNGCGVKFYNMKKEPAVCPSCGAENDPLAALRPRRGSTPRPVPTEERKPTKEEAKAAPEDDEDDDDLPDIEDIEDIEDIGDDDDDDLEEMDDDDDDDLIEDTADLGEDEDDLEEVREHIDGEPAKE
ncbi:MAG: TIGR02300 family protein [Rhodospirillaceae bacterium]